MANNKLIKIEGDNLQKVGNAISITNKVLAFNINKINAKNETLFISDIGKKVRKSLAKEYYEMGLYKMDPDFSPNNDELVPDYDEAIRNYTLAIDFDPNYSEAYAMRGLTTYYLNEYVGALKDYTKAIEIEPNERYYYGRANVYGKIGNYEEAIRDLTIAIELAPQLSNLYEGRALIKEKIGNYEAAVQDLTIAIEITPMKSYYYNRGNSKNKLGDKNGAYLDWKKAAELGHKDAQKKIN